MTNCTVCNSDQIETISFSGRIKHKDRVHDVPGLEKSTCKACGYEFMTAQQAANNDSLCQGKLLQLKGGMTPERIKEMRHKYGISQAKAAAIFGGGPRAFSKYETGEVTPSDAMEKLLWIAEKHACVIEDIAKREGVAFDAPNDFTPHSHNRDDLVAHNAFEVVFTVSDEDSYALQKYPPQRSNMGKHEVFVVVKYGHQEKKAGRIKTAYSNKVNTWNALMCSELILPSGQHIWQKDDETINSEYAD